MNLPDVIIRSEVKRIRLNIQTEIRTNFFVALGSFIMFREESRESDVKQASKDDEEILSFDCLDLL
jgi:hypothetical protein